MFVAGHNGMVGSAICRANTEYELLQIPRKDVDLRNQYDVDSYISHHKPDIVIICAASPLEVARLLRTKPKSMRR